MTTREHPCNTCKHLDDSSCADNCIFNHTWDRHECYNTDCMFNISSDVSCDMSRICGAYEGSGDSDLEFESDEEE